MEEVLIISSSDSDTDPNSDFELDVCSKNRTEKNALEVFDRLNPTVDLDNALPIVSYMLPSVCEESRTVFNSDLISDHFPGSRICKTKSVDIEFPIGTLGSTHLADGELQNDVESCRAKSKVSRQDPGVQYLSKCPESKSPDSLTVVFDQHFSKEKLFVALRESLETADISYSVEELPVPATIWWKDKNRTTLIEKQIIQFINGSDLSSLMGNFDQDFPEEIKKNIQSRALSILKKCGNCQITFVIFGMEKYFKAYKSHKAREFHDLVTGEVCTQLTKKTRKKKTLPSISKIDFEEVVIDLQLEMNTNFRFVENATDFSDIIISFTTSIQDAPSKRAKQQHGFSWHVHGSSSGTVKVDKSTAGLHKLWVQQLLQFNNVSKDIAHAIASKYPSPQSLLKAYQKCSSKIEAAKLLQNIEVRRGIAVLSTSKQIGPELSHKIYTLLTTKNPEEELHRI